jgi:hypothetical protein
MIPKIEKAGEGSAETCHVTDLLLYTINSVGTFSFYSSDTANNMVVNKVASFLEAKCTLYSK